jgi:hypothetical protein
LQALEAVARAVGPKMILLEYHTQDDYGTNETNDLFSDYGLIGTPTVVLNGAVGQNIIMGPKDYQTYLDRVNSLKFQKSTVLLSATVYDGGYMTADVEVTNLSSAALDNAKIYAVVYKDVGKSEYHYVVEDITPVFEISHLQKGQTESFTLKSSIYNTSMRHMAVIIKSSSGTIIQSLFAK